MLSPRSLVGPFIPIATAAFGAVALLALDIDIAINDRHPMFSPLRADIRLMLTLLAGGGFVWLGLVFIRAIMKRDRHEMAADINRVLAKLAEMDRTEPLPRLRIVATVPVPAPADCAPAVQQLPDNVRSFELGRQVGRKERDN